MRRRDWSFHDKWAERMGISKEISELINWLSDFPSECKKFVEFCKQRGEKVPEGHNSERRRWHVAKLKFEFLKPYGPKYLQAWLLHHFLDYIKKVHSYYENYYENGLEEMIRRFENKPMVRVIPSKEEWEAVKNFVLQNFEEIIRDG